MQLNQRRQGTQHPGDMGEGVEHNAKANVPQAPLSFDECSLEEKINRLRYALLDLTPIARQSHQLVFEVMQIATQHQHKQDGEAVMPIRPSIYPGGAMSQGSGVLSGANQAFNPLL